MEREKSKQRYSSLPVDVLTASPDTTPLPSNTHPHSKSSNFDYLTLFDAEESLFSSATNNFSVCALYLRRVQEAALALEDFLKVDPSRHFNDAIVFNLCTLYDLSCATELSTHKKKVLHRVATAYMVEDPYLNWKSFRLS